MTDAFDRLKNRARPSVPARDTSLIKTDNDEMTEFSHSQLVDSKQNRSQSSKTIVGTSKETSETAVPFQVDLSAPPDELEVVRRTLRIEEEIDTRLEEICSRERITRELFIEAAYLLASEDHELMQQILRSAKERYRRRKAIGERRKFMTLAKKHREEEIQ